MRMLRNGPVILIAAVIAVLAGSSALTASLFSGMTSAVEQNQLATMRAIVEFNLKSAQGRALARAEMVAELPRIQQLFAAQDRQGLLNELRPLFLTQKEKYGVDQAQFHLATNTAFLRLHAPERFGDDLQKLRPLVVAVNKDQLARAAPAIARSGPAVFGTVPVKDGSGKHLGVFEIGIDFGPLLDGLKQAYGLELSLLIEESLLRDYAKGMSTEVLNDANRVGKYTKVHATRWDLLKQLVSVQDLASASEEKSYTREALGVSYGTVLLPLRNAAGDQLGVIAVAKDFSGTRAAAGRTLVWQGATAALAAILLSGIVLVLWRGFLLRPLTMLGERFDALANGDTDASIDAPESLCTELQALAAAHETLRTRIAALETSTTEVTPDTSTMGARS